MSLVIITGSSGLVGSESVNFFCDKGFDVIGIDNNLRKIFFGKDGSTLWVKKNLQLKNKKFKHLNLDIRNYDGLERVFKKYIYIRPNQRFLLQYTIFDLYNVFF